MKTLTILLLTVFFQIALAKDFKTSIKVIVQMPEKAAKVVVVVAERNVGKEETVPPVWKVTDKNFDEMVKEFKSLPKNTDTITDCPRNYLMIEFVDNKKKTLKFSCYNNSNETRKKYVRFSQKIN